MKTGREFRTRSGHYGGVGVNSASFSPSGWHIVSASGDGTAKAWDTDTGGEVAQFVSFDDGEWICITAEGYYTASPKGDQYLNVRMGNEVYGIEAYRERFHRPDLAAERISGR
jgi:WD40 repeat protein